MRRNSFIALAAVAAVAVAGAVVALNERQESAPVARAGAALYPDLTDHLNDVTRIVLQSADGRVTLERQGERWVMPDRANYPVEFDKVRSLLLHLARLETVEPRTSKPELYSRLQVEDADRPEAKSVRVTVLAGDRTWADLIVGRSRPPGEGGGLFVRKAGEPQAWLVSGELRPDKGFVSWLDRNIVNVDQRRVQSVEIRHADGDRIIVAKPQPASGDYALQTPIPEGREPKPAHELSALPSITDFLILEDVRPASGLDWSNPPVTAEFRTYDGLALVMDAVERDGKTWVRVTADKIDPAPDTAAFVQENKGKDSPDGRTADLFKTPEEVAREAEAIDARVEGWAYRLTDYKTGKLKSRTADLTQEKKQEAQQPAGKDDPGSAAEAPDKAGQTVN